MHRWGLHITAASRAALLLIARLLETILRWAGRLLRRVVPLAAMASGIVCLLSLCFWLRGPRCDYHASWLFGEARYTLRSTGSQIVVYAPPPPFPRGRGFVASTDPPHPLRETPGWFMVRDWPNFPDLRPGPVRFIGATIGGIPAQRAWDFFGFSDRDLVSALEDPGTFASAHLVLSGHHHTDHFTVAREHPADDSCLAVYDGLKIQAGLSRERILREHGGDRSVAAPTHPGALAPPP